MSNMKVNSGTRRQLKKTILQRDGGRCAHCGTDMEAVRDEYLKATPQEKHELRRRWQMRIERAPHSWWDIDHIKQIAEGGAILDRNNLQTLCVPCHRKKDDKQVMPRDVWMKKEEIRLMRGELCTRLPQDYIDYIFTRKID